jgi:hypothetical protein
MQHLCTLRSNGGKGGAGVREGVDISQGPQEKALTGPQKKALYEIFPLSPPRVPSCVQYTRTVQQDNTTFMSLRACLQGQQAIPASP